MQRCRVRCRKSKEQCLRRPGADLAPDILDQFNSFSHRPLACLHDVHSLSDLKDLGYITIRYIRS